MQPEQLLGAIYELVSPRLDERQRRLLAAAAARTLGRGGITMVARARGMSRQTVYDGLADLDDATGLAAGRARRAGGGRQRLTERDPGLVAALEALVDPVTRGDPESPLRWTCKSTAQLARALTAQGHPVSDDTVGRLLKQQGYTLQRTHKTEEGAQHPDRDAQFRYVNEQARSHLAAGQPVVSVDTKKKELVGRYANGGAEWQPAGEPERVGVHNFPDPALGKARDPAGAHLFLQQGGRQAEAFGDDGGVDLNSAIFKLDRFPASHLILCCCGHACTGQRLAVAG